MSLVNLTNITAIFQGTKHNINTARIIAVSLTAFLFLSHSFLALSVACWAATRCSRRRFSRKTVTWQEKDRKKRQSIRCNLSAQKTVSLKGKRTVWSTDKNHANVQETRRRPSVTREGYPKVCFMAMYRSPLSKTKWKSEALTITIITYLRTWKTQ